MSRSSVFLCVLLFSACSSSSDGGGSGGASSGGSAGGAAGGIGGASDAGCVDGAACSACLDASCAGEIAACDGVPACTAARSDLATCFPSCSSSCWPNFQVSGGKPAPALRSCAKTSCAVCAP